MAGENTEIWDVMISYSWQYQTMAKRIKAWLNIKGFSVWFDEQNVTDGLYDDIAQGILNSAFILLCISKPYGQSPNCALEYKLAQDLKKPIIVAYMDRHRPKKALALITAGKYYHTFLEDISNKDFEDKMNKICCLMKCCISAGESVQDSFSEEGGSVHVGENLNDAELQEKVKKMAINKRPSGSCDKPVDKLELKINEIKRWPIKDLPGHPDIAKLMDVDDKVMSLCRCYGFLRKEHIQSIVAAAAGGGSPAYVFMQTFCIQKSDVPIKEFRKCLERHKEDFGNALKVIEKNKKLMLVNDLTGAELYELSIALTALPPGVLHDWQDVADWFDMKDVVDNCRNAIRQGNNYSPFDQLMDIIKTEIPYHTIDEFIGNLKSRNLNDVVAVVEDQIKCKAQRDIENKEINT